MCVYQPAGGGIKDTTMNVGMLWFDNDPRTALSVKVQRAADYYHQKYGKTVLMVTHDMENVFAYCDDVAVVADGSILVHTNAQDFFRDSKLCRSMNILPPAFQHRGVQYHHAPARHADRHHGDAGHNGAQILAAAFRLGGTGSFLPAQIKVVLFHCHNR